MLGCAGFGGVPSRFPLHEGPLTVKEVLISMAKRSVKPDPTGKAPSGKSAKTSKAKTPKAKTPNKVASKPAVKKVAASAPKTKRSSAKPASAPKRGTSVIKKAAAKAQASKAKPPIKKATPATRAGAKRPVPAKSPKPKTNKVAPKVSSKKADVPKTAKGKMAAKKTTASKPSSKGPKAASPKASPTKSKAAKAVSSSATTKTSGKGSGRSTQKDSKPETQQAAKPAVDEEPTLSPSQLAVQKYRMKLAAIESKHPKQPPKKVKRVSFDPKTLASIRQGLELERESLIAQREQIEEAAFATTQSEWSGETGYDEDSADAGTATFERERDLSIANNAQDLIDKINKALEKIEDGSYGLCESCGAPIPADRLKAVPYVLLCINCKKAEERR